MAVILEGVFGEGDAHHVLRYFVGFHSLAIRCASAICWRPLGGSGRIAASRAAIHRAICPAAPSRTRNLMETIDSNAVFFARLRSLIDSWCDRRDLRPLASVLGPYLAFDGLTDSWGRILEALKTFARFGERTPPERTPPKQTWTQWRNSFGRRKKPSIGTDREVKGSRATRSFKRRYPDQTGEASELRWKLGDGMRKAA